jgi:hypothetical protein
MKFNKSFARFHDHVKPFARADDVGFVITEFLWFAGRPFYPLASIMEATVASVCLSAQDAPPADEDDLDLIFRMRAENGGHFYEIVLRSETGTSYGGWTWGQNLEISQDIVNGYHVLVVDAKGVCDRFEYDPVLRRYGCPGSMFLKNQGAPGRLYREISR